MSTKSPVMFAALLFASAMSSASAQLGSINFLTDLGTPFPPGCLSIQLPDQPASSDALLVNDVIDVPSVNSTRLDSSVRVRIWRVACADDGFSVVLVQLAQISGPDVVVVPTVFADDGIIDIPFHEAQLVSIPGSANVGASGQIVTEAGNTWMLAVEPVSIDGASQFLPEDYNDTFTLELNWGNFSPAQPEGFVFTLDRFEPALDRPQFDQPVLNGRYSGQWVRAGAERQGLVLQIAEQIEQNFVFAIFFTYLEGQPIWVVGNSEPEVARPGPVTVEMFTLENGAFITDASQPPAEQIPLNAAGSISIEPIDCHRIRVDYDFTPLGNGSGSMELDRLVRIAGYDCNPWQ